MKNISRVFISSTFNDFRLERAVLQKFIFPKVKKEAHKKNISFLPIDLRWGVPEEAQIDHRTMDICLNEVERSKTEPHPDFIILSGDKYGWVPITRVIEKKEFEAILNKLKELSEDISILEKWYELDENQIPVSYILKSRDEVTDKDYTNWKNWIEVEDEIRRVIQKAVKNLELDKKKKEKYFISATHKEFKTFLKDNKEPQNYIISFIRKFEELEKIDKNIKEKLADENKEKIEEFRKEIKENTLKENLKESKTTSKVYEKLIKEYSKENIEEVFKDINSLEEIKGSLGDKEFENYLIEFAKFIEEKLINSLDKVKTEFSEKDYQEDFKNFLFNKPFIGRDEEIKEILESIKENNKVLIYGESGVGKSAIMAHLIDKLENEEKEYQIVYRFSGATKTSSTLLTLLNSILEEVGIEVEKENDDLLNQQENLKTKLLKAKLLKNKSIKTKLLKNKSAKTKPLKNKSIKTKLLKIGKKLNKIEDKTIIVIDAIDQLGTEKIDELKWLPNNKNIKIVISALNDKNYKEDTFYFQKLNQIFNSIEIKRVKDKKELLNKLLEIENRTLQDNQFEYVLNKKDSDKALYLSIAKEELKFWRSYDELTDNSKKETKTKRYLSSTQKEIIKEYFDNLKTLHNIIPELIDKTLGYISASQEHLSEDLLLEVLSKDEELLSKIENEYHKNLTNELPPAVWSIFIWMIKNYIKENKLGFIEFYHREFEDIIDEFYNENLAKKLTLILENLFPNETALIAYIYTLANRFNHKENITKNEYEKVVKELSKLDDLKIETYLQTLREKGDEISKLENPAPAFGYLEVALNISKLLYKQAPDKWVEYYTSSLNNLGSLYLDTGKIEKAEKLYKEAVEIIKKAYEQNPDRWIEYYVGLLNNLGLLYSNTGKIEKAEKLFKEALEIIKKAYEHNPDRWLEYYTGSLNNLGSLYYQTNQIEKAEKCFKEILTVLENIDYLTFRLKQIKQNAIRFFGTASNKNNSEVDLIIDLISVAVLSKLQETEVQTIEDIIDIIIEVLKEFEIDESMYETFAELILEKLFGENDE